MHELIKATYIINLSKYNHISWSGCDPFAFMVKYGSCYLKKVHGVYWEELGYR
jgi:hypothetical protein